MCGEFTVNFDVAEMLYGPASSHFVEAPLGHEETSITTLIAFCGHSAAFSNARLTRKPWGLLPLFVVELSRKSSHFHDLDRSHASYNEESSPA